MTRLEAFFSQAAKDFNVNVYIAVDKIFKAIFKLIFPLDYVIVKSETIFSYNRLLINGNAIDRYLDTDRSNSGTDESILIRFKNIIVKRRLASGGGHGQPATYTDTIEYNFKNTFFDEDTSKTTYSFFKYNNCLELLKELLFSFGLLWHTHITLINILCPWKFEFIFKLVTRFQSNLNPNLVPEILNNIEGNIIQEKQNGVTVTTSSGSITNYEHDYAKIPSELGISDKIHTNKDGTLQEKFEWFTKVGYATPNNKMKNITTSFISMPDFDDVMYRILHFENIFFYSVYYQCLWIVHLNQIYPVNKFICNYYEDETETYPQQDIVERFSDIHGNKISKSDYVELYKHSIHRLHFASMVANYYGGKYGIYNRFNSQGLKFTVDTLEVNLLDKVEIRYANYIVMHTEKDFLHGTTKLELRGY
jgi:hypothetical protein